MNYTIPVNNTVSSRNKHWVGAAIAGISAIAGLFGQSKAQREQKNKWQDKNLLLLIINI